MNSEQKAELEALLNETEANIKLLEVYSKGFVTSVLNEWRYATRHMLGVVFDPNDEESFKRTVAHLQRARYDSYDFLLVYQIDEIKKFRDYYLDYTEVIKPVIPDYGNWQIRLNAAVRLHRDWFGKDKREMYYEQVKTTNAELEIFLSTLENTREECSRLIRKFTWKVRWQTFGWIVATLGSIASVGSFMGWLISRL